MYNYILTWQGNNGSVNKTTNNTSFTIYNLDPGSAYNFSVTTVTADGTLSTPTWNSSCTSKTITAQLLLLLLDSFKYLFIFTVHS